MTENSVTHWFGTAFDQLHPALQQLHRQQHSIRWHRVPLPTGLFPRTTAYKCIENEKYRFHVEFSLPKIGLLLSYSGMLNT